MIKKTNLIWIGVPFLVLLDYVSKNAAKTAGIGHINSGVALGLFDNASQVTLIAASLVAVAGLCLLALTGRVGFLGVTGLMLIVSGAIGNALSRILWGGVWDWIAIGAFPAFNAADVLIDVGMLVFAISEIKRTLNGRI